MQDLYKIIHFEVQGECRPGLFLQAEIETTGEIINMQISEETYQQLKDQIRLEDLTENDFRKT